jgi:uncharacterized RDD family membrane protein YckC
MQPQAVYYRYEDYAGFWRRIFVDLIDLVVVFTVCTLTVFAAWTLSSSGTTTKIILLACAAFAYAYFVPLKRSRFRTVGYRIGGVRVVGMDGDRAGWFALTLRFLFAALGPMNWFVDLGWLSGDPHRQSLRDKFAQTYVVKVQAKPAGPAQLVHQYAEICGFNFLFREVKVDESVARPPIVTQGQA